MHFDLMIVFLPHILFYFNHEFNYIRQVNIHKNGQNRIFAPMTPVPFSKNDSRYDHEEYAPLV